MGKPLAVSIASAGEALDVSRHQVYRLVKAGELETVMLPGITGQRILWSELERYVNEAARQADAERADVIRLVRAR